MDISDSSNQTPTSREAKKPYEKPAFQFERVFETTALTCMKVTGTSHCSGPKKS